MLADDQRLYSFVSTPNIYDVNTQTHNIADASGGVGGLLLLLLQTTTATTTLPAGRVRRDRRHILDAADLHRRTGQRAQRRLGSRSGRLGLVAAGGAQLDVQRGDAQRLALLGDVLRIRGKEPGMLAQRQLRT